MKIARITKQSSRDRYNIFSEAGFVGAISAEVLAESGLREGDEVDPGQFETYLTKDEYGKVLAKAYDLLSRRPHSRQELLTKLSHRKYDPELIQKVLAHLTELAYLDDAEFARRWVALRETSRGSRLLRQELRKKGIDDHLISDILGERADRDETAEVLSLARTRVGRYAGEPWEAVRPKLLRYLGSRGYDFAVVLSVVEKLRGER